MLKPIYEKNTVMYGNEGKYVLKNREGNEITYEFIPWAADRMIVQDKKTLKELSEILHIKIIWAVYEDL